ncbi:MAG: nickel-dependent hydrogenase large subunit, partial [Planctomycetaceae bacterium]
MAESERSIRVEVLTRVEGEGALHIHARGGELQRVELRIFEPPRLFESLLRGRSIFEAADVTARICGICPVAYQMTTVHAIEAALGIEVPPEIRQLRRLLYCGEWIESHSLHIHLLHAPDFLGYESGLKMAADHRAAVERGLRLKKHGNQLLATLGGRAVHPVNVTVGGFFKSPSRAALQRLIPDFEWGLEAAIEVARWVARFEKPDNEIVEDCQVCLR